jgi:sterol desaturase/sphingolipid hydroxylase (fatty acid hydroxylase superfamily)
MSIYLTFLFYAIPSFSVLIFIEMFVAKMKGIEINRSSDMISSLSSGLTNTIKDALKFGVILISYSSMVDSMTIYKLNPIWLAVVIAFVVVDFSGYWMHRLNHRVNIFWNRHVIHHSSEEFNLSCALRQSISTTFKFSAILFIPAALLGVPAYIFAILGPIHLFMQFWYHTQLIGKMSVLEYIIVTPSHHRVHHAINSVYLDRNYGQIFIIWDKLFGSFQVELDEVKPVYGILRPAKTWNPILISYKHLYQLIKDAWHAEHFIDKVKIWFMPTGWRPEDVSKKYPLEQIEDPLKQVKYDTETSMPLSVWSWIQYLLTVTMMLHMFTVVGDVTPKMGYMYALFLFIQIFSLTALLDGKSYSMIAELVKIVFAAFLLYNQQYSWYGISGVLINLFSVYLIGSLIITYSFLDRGQKRINTENYGV